MNISPSEFWKVTPGQFYRLQAAFLQDHIEKKNFNIYLMWKNAYLQRTKKWESLESLRINNPYQNKKNTKISQEERNDDIITNINESDITSRMKAHNRSIKNGKSSKA
jgi:hypothetical protein